MADGYSWHEMRGGATYRLPGPEHLGWWAALAMVLSIILHIVVFLVLDSMKIALRYEQARELNTRSINVSQVEVRPQEHEVFAPEEEVITPPADASSLLEEVDLLSALPENQEIDIKPDLDQAEYALKMQNPALKGDPSEISMEISKNLEIDAEMPDLGREPESLKPAEIGQVTVDPGAATLDDGAMEKFTEDLIKGASGIADKGSLDGVTTLDDMLGLPPNVLLSSKTMLPSDLLFEFNSSDLRESAKVGLMKLALLMDRNPDLFCWIEGHTDLIGGDDFNLNLSIRRAEAVKNHLVKSMRMDQSRIITRGFGRFQPLVATGDRNQQSINRRVEIRMRKTPPNEAQMILTPQKAQVVEEPPKPVLVKPVLVKPVEAPVQVTPPKAILVKPKRFIPEALPVETPPRAQPVETPPAPRALPVEE